MSHIHKTKCNGCGVEQDNGYEPFAAPPEAMTDLGEQHAWLQDQIAKREASRIEFIGVGVGAPISCIHTLHYCSDDCLVAHVKDDLARVRAEARGRRPPPVLIGQA